MDKELNLDPKHWKYDIGTYICAQLKRLNISHTFGVAGNYIIGFLNYIIENNISFISTCNELNAGYAADSYARIRGISCLVTTYNVGELSALNAVAGAYAEKIPMIIIAGTPSISDRNKLLLKHHTIGGDYDTSLKIFRNCTVATELIVSAEQAQKQIDISIEKCLKYSRPIYIAIPFGMEKTNFTNSLESKYYLPAFKENEQEVDLVVDQTVKIIQNAINPIIIVGADAHRYKLQSKLESFIEETNLPFSTMVMSKAIINEEHPNFVGIYLGASSKKIVKEQIENSDCLICFGVELTDINLDRYSANLKYSNMILAINNKVIIKGSCHDNISLNSFINRLFTILVLKESYKKLTPIIKSSVCFRQSINEKNIITNEMFFNKLSSLLHKDDILISDTGSAIFSVRHLQLPKNSIFIAQPYYASIGYSIGAALGAAIATTNKRIFVIVGDGAFQAACQELSSIFKYGLKVIFFLLNNNGYTIERLIHDSSYNDIFPWKYHRLPEILGDGKGYEVHTNEELEQAINDSILHPKSSLIEIHLEKFDCSIDLLSNYEKTFPLGINYEANPAENII